MTERLVVGVVGLGKFGLAFGHTLVRLGHRVVGIDQDEENVRNARHVLTQVYAADATNKDVLEQIGFADFSHVLISVGDSIAASSMIAMYLKELGVPSVWVKAIHADHEKLLYRVGADEVFIPEFLAAQQLANRIAFPGIIENLPFDHNMALKEVEVDKWKGMTLRQVDLTNRFGVQVIAVRKGGTDQYRYIPKADDELEKGDQVVLIGKLETLTSIES